jgi:Ca2+-binding RTX toxin-like protein
VSVTNAATGTPIAVFNYVLNTNVVVNGNDGTAGDADTLTLRGTDPANPATSGDDTFDVDLTRTGTAGDELVRVTDNGTSLYNVQSFTNFATLNVQMLGGGDTATLVGALAGNVAINVDGGADSFLDTVIFPGVADAGDLFEVFDGAAGSATTVLAARSGSATTRVNLTGTDQIVIDGGGGAGADTIQFFAPAGVNTYLVTAASASAGAVSVNADPTVRYTGLGTDGSSIGLLNDVLGGSTTASVTVTGTAAPHSYTYSPTDATSAALLLDDGISAVSFGLINFGSVRLDGGGGDDSLRVSTPAGLDVVTLTPGTLVDQGTVAVRRAVGLGGDLLGLSFADLGGNGFLTFDDAGGGRTDELVVQGTSASNVFDVNAAGVVTVSTAAAGGGIVGTLLPVFTPGVTFLDLFGLDGDDTFFVAGNHPFAGGMLIDGGNPSASDAVVFTGDGSGAVAIDLAAGTIGEAGFGSVGVTGAEAINVDGGGAALTLSGTPGDDTVTVSPAGPGAGSFTASAAHGIAFGYTNTASLTVDGGSGGFDTLVIDGNDAANVVTATATDITLDGSTVGLGAGLELLTIQTFGGNDNIDLSAFTAMPTRILSGDGNDNVVGSPQADWIDAGEGNDTVNGGAGNDTIYGSGGNDSLIGGPGADQMFGGDGSDTFVWNPGDGSDVIEGGDGTDVLLFNGSPGDEIFTLNSNGARVQFLRNLGGINMDLAGVEQLTLNALGGADTVNVNDVSGSDLRVLNVNLGADGAVDVVNVNGTANADAITVTSPAAGSVDVVGLKLAVHVLQADATDQLAVNAQGGNDTIGVVSPADTVMQVLVNGGTGTDTLDLSGLTTGRTIDLAAGTVTGFGSVTGIESFVGTPAADTIVGANVANTWNLTGPNAGTVTNATGTTSFTGVENATGGTAADSFVIGPGATLGGSIDGGAGSDTVTGPDRVNLWTVTGANAGAVAGVNFANVENLAGGAADDRFVFANGASVAGTVSGGTGTDTLDYSAYATPVAVNLATATATGTGGFTGIEGAVGGTGSDTLTGANTANSWDVTSTNAGTVGGFTFAGFENLTGGSADDDFTFAYAATVTGALDGGAGFDTVTQLGNGAANTVNATATGVTLDGVQVPIGTSIESFEVDTLGGDDTINLAQGSNLTVDGGTGTDTINVAGNAGANDAFAFTPGYDSASGTLTATGGLGASSAFSNVELLSLDGGGGTGADSLSLTGTDAPDSFSLTATAGAAAGTASVNHGTVVAFQNFGSAGSSVSVAGLGGNDNVSVAQAVNWGITTVNVDGGQPSFGNSVSITGTAVADAFVWTPSTGVLTVTPAGSPTTTYNLTNVQTAGVDGAAPSTAPGDTLVVSEPNSYVVPSPLPVNNGPPIVGPTNLLYKNVESVQINKTPVAVNDTATTPENTPLSINVLGNDTNLNDAPLAVRLTAAPLHGTATVTAANQVLYTPAANYSGPDSFSYTVTDANNETSNAAVVSLTVTPVADAPVANPDTFVGTKNQTLTVAAPGVLANDTPANLLHVVKVTDPAHGTLTLNADGSFTYVPNTNFAGTDSFTYKMNDGQADSNVATVTISVQFLGGVGPGAGNDVVVAGSDTGTLAGTSTPAGATVRVFDASNGTVKVVYRPFGGFAGGIRVASGDFNKDGIPDVVYGTGPGTPARVQVVDGKTGAVLFDVQPFEASFTGGVFVSAGDINGDGFADLVISPDVSGGPRVRVFDGRTFTVMADFFGITGDPNFRGGVRTAIGDLNGDGFGDLIVAAGFGGGPRIAFFDGKALASGTPAKQVNDIFVFEQTLRNGVFVAAGDVDGDGFADLMVGGGPGGGPRVQVLSGQQLSSGSQQTLANFFAGDPAQRGGIRVAVANLDNDNRADMVVGSGSGPQALLTGYTGKDFPLAGVPPVRFTVDAFPEFDSGVFVG